MTEIAKPLPCALEAERQLLGAIIIESNALNAIATILRPADFFLAPHQRIFRAMLDLSEKRSPIDSVTLMENLGQNGALESVGGIVFLSQLADGIPRVANVEHYARIVKEKSLLRRLIHDAQSIQDRAMTGLDEVSAIVDGQHEQLAHIRAEIASDERLRRVRTLSDILSIQDFPDDGEDWIVERFVLRGGTTMISAPPSKYKSWLALLLCKSILSGSKFLGRFRTARHRILYLDRENRPGRVKSRAATIALVKDDPWLSYWSKIQAPPKLGDPRLVEIAREFKPLIIFDTFVRFGNLTDENSASEMARLLEQADELTQFGASNVLLHHPTKNGGSWFRGSGDLEAYIDLGFSITETGDKSGQFILKCEKTRDDEEFQLTFEPRPSLDDIGDFAIVDAPAQSRDEADADRLLDFITKNPGATRDRITTAKIVPEKRARLILDRYANRKWRVDVGLYNAATYHPISPVR